VSVTANFNWRFKFQEHGLLHEDFSGDFTKHRNLFLSDLDGASAGIDHLIDDIVNV